MGTFLVLELEEEGRKTETSIPTVIPTKQWVVYNGGKANASLLKWGGGNFWLRWLLFGLHWLFNEWRERRGIPVWGCLQSLQYDLNGNIVQENGRHHLLVANLAMAASG